MSRTLLCLPDAPQDFEIDGDIIHSWIAYRSNFMCCAASIQRLKEVMEPQLALGDDFDPLLFFVGCGS